jgi:NADH-quinone oxidoreductase subunit N
VNLTEYVNNVYHNTVDVSMPAFGPELVICATIVLMLVVRLFNWGRRVDVSYLVLAGAIVGFVLALYGPAERTEIFTGMLVYDKFTLFMRAFLLLFLILFVVLTKLSGIPDREDGPDIYSLVFGATLGMCLMSSANHLFMVFVAVEMASVPSYALAGLLKGRRQSSEAALKYAIYGAGAAGVMLYGISLVAGLLNTAHMPTIALELARRYAEFSSSQLMVLALASLMILVGLAFKLSAVPFHFWCPDVFEGAAAEVNAFLSVASKAAALALLLRVILGVGAVPPGVADEPVAVQTAPRQHLADGALYVMAQDPAVAAETSWRGREEAVAQLAPVRNYMGWLVAFIAAITCTFGNLAAYGQTNIKRLLAYSTIAHAGYMMMAAPPILALVGLDSSRAHDAAAALALYIAIYLFMNLGAFAIVAFLRNSLRSEEIADYAGLVHRAPWIVICFSIILFSLVGLPPLAGFLGKFAVFAALADGYVAANQAGVSASHLLWLLVIGGMNTAISLFYYVRVVKVMTIDPEPESRTPFSVGVFPVAYVVLLTIPLVVLIFSWNFLNEWTLQAAAQLF